MPDGCQHIPLPPVQVDSKPRESYEFYKHPYGGIGRNVWVTKEQFARFFEVQPHTLDDLPVNMKWFDVLGQGYELLGYIIQDVRDAKKEYKIVIIDRRKACWVKYLDQETEKAWVRFAKEDADAASGHTLSHSAN